LHIVENWNAKAGRTYCYASECVWDKELKRYFNPRISIGHIEGEPAVFTPNRAFANMLLAESNGASNLSPRDKHVITAAITKYGESIRDLAGAAAAPPKSHTAARTAEAIFLGPMIVFGGITSRYGIDKALAKAFGDNDARDILSLAWYLACEGNALGNADAWLCRFENPAGRPIHSREITAILDRMNQDGIMTFYKEWLSRAGQAARGKVLYDLTSISWYGHGLDMAAWGHNRDEESLPQINFALLCARDTAMPLFAWPLEGSISDVRTLRNTLELLDKLGYKPDCLMMDRGFASMDNISYMLEREQTFLQALRVNAGWIRDIIDAGRELRLRPDSISKASGRTYYSSSTDCLWVTLRKADKKGCLSEETVVWQRMGARSKYPAKEGETVVSSRPCTVFVLFCQDLVGNQWDRFMESLNVEYNRLVEDEGAEPVRELKRYFIIAKEKYARKRSVSFNMDMIARHRDMYVGHVCFVTNDKTIKTAADALGEYSTRDYIEKDFDEMKNDLDMRRIRVHTDARMKARLLIQFIAEIYMREIRMMLRKSKECAKLTKTQISSHIKGIYKIKFKNKYRDVKPELSKIQRAILEALEFGDSR
jgi:hypothetical protein